MLTDLFFLRYINCCPDFFDHVGKRHHKKREFQNLCRHRKQIFTIILLPDISRSKGNQTIKFGQLNRI